MVRSTLSIVIVCILFLTESSVHAQDVQLHASIDSSSVRIGDWIRLRVTAEFPPGVTSISPMLTDSLGVFEVLRVHASPVQIEEESHRQIWNIRLTSFEAMEGVIPPVPFSYSLEEDSTPRFASTLPIPIGVTGVETDPKGEIKDIKPPLRPPWAFEDFLPYGILTLILAALGAGYYYYRRRKRLVKAPERVVPQIPPHVQALYALHALEEKRLWQQGKIKEYYSEVTEIIRRFFEGRFGIIALEMTSDEILRQLKRVPEALGTLKEIKAFFLTADLVKFAKHTATLAEHENELMWAYAIVRSMVPRPPEPQEREEVAANVR